MKTHDIANSLNLLAKMLRALPNTELSEINLDHARKNTNKINYDDFPTALLLLSALSKYTKKDWSDVIHQYELAVNLRDTDKKKLSKWATREKQALLGVNLLLLTMFKDHLQGTKNEQLRETLAFVIPKNKDKPIKKIFGITIRRS